RRRLDQRVEHGLQVESRAADHLQHVGGGGLLLKRLAQIVRALPQLGEQPEFLDCGHGLIREISDQLDLLLTKWSNFLSVDCDRADKSILVKHLDNGKCSRAGKFGGSGEIGVSLDPDLVLRPSIEDVNHLFRPRHTTKATSLVCNKWPSLQQLGECWRYAEHGSCFDKVIVETEKYAKIGFANSRRVLQYGAKDGSKLARRTIDDAQHLGSGRLLLQRFVQLVEQPRVLNGNDGLCSEALDQVDLFVRERPHFSAINKKCADQLLTFEHRHPD